MKIKKMNDVFRVVRGYLGGFRWNEEIATRWAFPIAFSLMIASFGIMKHIPSRIESGEWVYVIMAMIAVTMIWVNAVQFIMMHFKVRAEARANRKRQEEEKALNDLEMRMLFHDLGDGKGMVLYTPGEEKFRKIFIVGRNEYMKSQ